MCEASRVSDLRILRNGPPGTFVVLESVRISLPTDQIVDTDASAGSVAVAFGGMRFDGISSGRLTFQRVRDLRPDAELSPDRSWTMTLEPGWVTSVHEYGRQVWPPAMPRDVGLCASCSHARVIASSHKSAFLLCQRSTIDPQFPRYPPLPIRACRGHEQA
jgi:hypothetical protein